MEYAVIGLGRFGVAVAKELEANGHRVIAVDINPAKCRSIAEYVTTTVILDATDEKAIKQASLHHIDTIIIGMGASSMNESLLTALVLKDLGIKTIIAKATSDEHGKILEKIGVNKIIKPESDMGIRLARKLQSGSILDFIELSEEIRMDGLEVSGTCNQFAGRSIYDVNLRKYYGINIVCIKRGKELIIADRETMIETNDILLVVGESDKMDRFEKKMGIKL
jgi:trk system potassium uptake protein TrkA